MAQIKIRICPDGMVYAETKGIKGKACSDYGKVIEQLTDAKVLDKEFTEEYYQENHMLDILEERGNRVKCQELK